MTNNTLQLFLTYTLSIRPNLKTGIKEIENAERASTKLPDCKPKLLFLSKT